MLLEVAVEPWRDPPDKVAATTKTTTTKMVKKMMTTVTMEKLTTEKMTMEKMTTEKLTPTAGTTTTKIKQASVVLVFPGAVSVQHAFE